ncbi:ribonuclease J [archaeon CG10_big_fil_rev_8_21_14_0_10_43_11]|nr:MAG: ribonuclease J [archaeon CG10_big_fil_rev_8_21_14_0_10_43_11]
MPVEIFSIGGYEEVGRNMTAVKVDDEIVILDMGWDLSKVLLLPKEKEWREMSVQELIEIQAFPDDEILIPYRKQVKAIVCSHAHLDHISAIPKMAPTYGKAPIIGAPFTLEVLKALIKDTNVKLPNQLLALKPGQTKKLTKSISIEFIYTTHSTVECSIVAVHTPYGVVVYANDWKFDEQPVLGPRTDTKRLKELGKSKDVLALVSCCLNVEKPTKTFSEVVVREMLRDILFGIENDGKGIVITTFASHISRIKTIVELSKKLGRKPVLFGSSMAKYMNAAEKVGIVNLKEDIELYARGPDVKKKMREIMKEGKHKYLLITTGHQGEPGAVLDRLSKKELPYKLSQGDQIIFSSNVIPSPVNISNVAELEQRLKRFHPRIFKDVHASGHASKEDHRDLMKMLRPKNYIPCHGPVDMLANAISLAYDFNMRLGKEAHILQNGQRLALE